MEVLFLALLVLLMALALGSGFPVAFALPGSAILTIGAAALAGWLAEGDTAAFFHSGSPQQWLSAGVTNLRGIYWEVERDTLIAIPLFIFMGIMLQRSKIAEDLLVAMAQLFGPVPGGLGISVVFVGALLAATTGIVGATVVAMGLISLPAMLRNNYSKPLATGAIAASGTLGQIIPPSIVLIILADQLGSAADMASTLRKNLYTAATGDLAMPSQYDASSTSAGEMFLGALVPGFLLVGLYMLFILFFALARPKLAPAVPFEGDRDAKFWGRMLITLVPPLALIFAVLGSIIGGVATVNQAGAIGAAGALLMAGYRLRQDEPGAYHPVILALVSLFALWLVGDNYNLNLKALRPGDDLTGVMLGALAAFGFIASLVWSGIRVMGIENTLHDVMLETAKTAALVFVILLGAAILVAAFRAFGGEEHVREFLQALPGGFWSQFIIVMLVIFFLGFFLDFIEIAVVVVPIVAPILLADPTANITAVWLGVMIGLNIQTSFLTPPFGFALFYLRGVAPPSVRTTDMYKGVVAFISLQLLALVIVGLYPPLVNYVPQRSSLTAETAPPPRNPRLQACVEDYVLGRIRSEESVLRGAISTARALDRSYLPDDLAKALADGFDSAETAIARLFEADEAAKLVKDAAPAYLPVMQVVRALERDIARVDAELAVLRTSISRIRDDDDEDRRPRLEGEVAELEVRRAELVAQIPADWEQVYDTFRALEQAEEKLRVTFRRSGEASVESAGALSAALAATPALLELRPEIEALAARLAAARPDQHEALSEAATVLRDRVGAIPGATDVRSALHATRQSLRGRAIDPEKAAEALASAQELIDGQMVWRSRAEAELAPGLEAYLAAVSETIGVRSLSRMPRTMALSVASCESNHRNLSIHF